jgi:hypothetical protein
MKLFLQGICYREKFTLLMIDPVLGLHAACPGEV